MSDNTTTTAADPDARDETTPATGQIDWRKLLNIAVMALICYVLGLLYSWSLGSGWPLASKLAVGSTIPWVIGNLQRTGGVRISLPDIKGALIK